MRVKLEGGPCDQRTKDIEKGDTEILRLAPLDRGGYLNRWFVYRKTNRQDENGLPIFVFYWATDEDDDDGPPLES